jgi:serine phosphatase RsbU (regulator of sigma subunit)
VQESFLPDSPQLARLADNGSSQTARATTGDFCDFIPLPGHKYGVVIADVTDRAWGSLFMTSTRTLMRAFASNTQIAPIMCSVR